MPHISATLASNCQEDDEGTFVTLKINSKFLAASPNGDLEATAGAAFEPQTWIMRRIKGILINLRSKLTKMTMMDTGEKVAFQSFYGKYLCAEPSGRVIADRLKPLEWEHWTLIKVSDYLPLTGSLYSYDHESHKVLWRRTNIMREERPSFSRVLMTVS